MQFRTRHRFVLLTVLTAFTLGYGCEEPQPGPGKADDGRIILNGLPEGSDSWYASIHTFSSGECVDASESTVSEGLTVSESGTGAVVLAFNSDGSVVPGASVSGLPASSYFFYLKDREGIVPDIWYWEGDAASAKVSGVKMKRFPPVFTMDIVAEPEDFVSATATIDNIVTRFSINGVISVSANPNIVSRSFTLSGSEQHLTSFLMPMAGEGSWMLPISILMDGKEPQTLNLAVSERIKSGDEVSLSLDFTDYLEKGKAVCRLVVKNEEGNKTWVKSITLKEVLPENRYYEVSVQQPDGSWKPAEVYDALVSDAPSHHSQIWNDWNNSKKLRDTSSFTLFTSDFSSPVKVRVKSKRAFSTARIRPTEYGIVPEVLADNTMEFTIPDYEKRKLSLELDGDRFHNLMILPDKPDPERPDPKNIPSNMKYYGPGIWNPEWITLKAGETLYIDEGAVVYAKVNITGDGASIKGRGILSGARLAHTGDRYASGYQLIETNANKIGTREGFTASGVTVVDSPSWTFSIYRTNNVKIDGVNIICWILNGDGIDLCSVDGAEIKDCFIRVYDDCITLKVNHLSLGDTKNVRIENNLIWADFAGGIVVGPESGSTGTGRIHDVTVKNCIVLDYPTKNTDPSKDDRGGLCISQYPSGGTTSGLLSGILFEDIVIDNIRPNGRPISVWQKPSQGVCTMEDVVFRNIRIISESGCGSSSVYSNGNIIKGLKFQNVTYNSAPIQDSGKWIVKGSDIDISY